MSATATKPSAQGVATETADAAPTKWNWAALADEFGPSSLIKVLVSGGVVGVLCFLFYQSQINWMQTTHEDRTMFQDNLKSLRDEHQQDRKEITSGLNKLDQSVQMQNEMHREMLQEMRAARRGTGSMAPSESKPHKDG
jgi:hypothetical protein